MSLPSRERGLKSTQSAVYIILHQSLPSRERGLKSGESGSGEPDEVAPLAGAWIEIIGIVYRPKFGGSLPSWERGLKFLEMGILACN